MRGRSEMIQEWNSWDPVLLQHFKQIDHILQNYYRNTGIFGVAREDAQDFALNRLRELISESTKG
jgi:hypothetical protein